MSGHVTAQHKFYLVLASGKRAELQACLKGIWCNQDIAVARAQHGPTTFIRTSTRSAEAYGGLGASSPQKSRNFTASQVGSETIYRIKV